MQMTRTRRIVLGGAAALGLAAGAAGIAGAATGGSDGGAGHESDDEAVDYTSSITVDDTAEADDEAAESATLAAMVTISADEARDAALAEVPGDATEPELENEDGNVVYGIEVTAADGTITDVKVDAGNGDILAQEAETDDDGPEGDDVD